MTKRERAGGKPAKVVIRLIEKLYENLEGGKLWRSHSAMREV